MMVAIIPARGGSKRIPKKNVRLFNGVPMLRRAIDTARLSGLFDRIIVSTDDEEISKCALSAGAEIPFIRPPELADDHAGTSVVINHGINKLSLGAEDYVCCIYPCTPLVSPKELVESFKYMIERGTNACMPICEFPSPPQRGFSLDAQGRIERVNPENELTRTQDLATLYYDAGQFYWGSVEAWLTDSISCGSGFILPGWRYVDIDTESDWLRAELVYQLIS